MPSYWTIFNACMPVFLLIGAGFVLRWRRILTSEADASLLRVALNLLFPAFIIDHLLGNPALRDPGNLGAATGSGALFVLCGIAIAYTAARSFGASGQRRRAFGLSVGLQNYGFIPIPIILALFDNDTIGVQLMHSLGVELALWTAGIMLITGGGKGGWKHLFNAPLITTVICVTANFAGFEGRPPQLIDRAVVMLSSCAVPLCLLLTGATIRDLLRSNPEAGKLEGRVGEAFTAIVLRLLAIPALMILFARYLPISVELKRVIAIQAAMPSAVFPIVLAKRYGGDAATAVRVAVTTSAIAAFSIPPAIVLGLWLTGAGG